MKFLLFLIFALCFEEQPISEIQLIDPISTSQLKTLDKLIVSFPIPGQELVVLLTVQERLAFNLGKGFAKPYIGRILSPNDSNSLVRLSGFEKDDNLFLEGIIEYKREVYRIRSLSEYRFHKRDIDKAVEEQTEKMVIYQSKPALKSTLKCGHDDSEFNRNQSFSGILDNALLQEAKAGCPGRKRELQIGIAADCTYFNASGRDMERITNTIISNMNIVSGIYEKAFNVVITISSLMIQQECNKTEFEWNQDCSSRYSLDQRLNDFSRWRATNGSRAGLWHLLSGCSDSSVVGIAWLNQLCNIRSFRSGNDWISGTGITTKISTHSPKSLAGPTSLKSFRRLLEPELSLEQHKLF